MGAGATAFWGGKIAAKKERAQANAEEAEKKAGKLPKVFDYYCPHCLFQTNEYSKLCPSCRQGGLEKTKSPEEIKGDSVNNR